MLSQEFNEDIKYILVKKILIKSKDSKILYNDESIADNLAQCPLSFLSETPYLSILSPSPLSENLSQCHLCRRELEFVSCSL